MRVRRHVGRKVGDLEEARGEGVNGWFCLVLFIVADGGDLACQRVSPGLAREEARQDEAVVYLANTVRGAANEFVRAGLVVGKDAHAQKAPFKIVVSRMSWVASVMVPLAVSSTPKGISRARGRCTTL